MAVPRAFVFALVGAVLVFAAFMATRGGAVRDATHAQSAPAPAPPQATRSADRSTPETPGSAAQGRPGPVRTPEKEEKPAPAMPPEVQRALDRHHVVVLFFADRRAADDWATYRRLTQLFSDLPPALRRDADVFHAELDRLADYGEVVGSLGISQSPATVVVGTDGEARVLEGFLDKGSLRQHLVDAGR